MVNHLDNQSSNHDNQENSPGEMSKKAQEQASQLLRHMDLSNKLAIFAHKAIESEQSIQVKLCELDMVFNALSDALLDNRQIQANQISDHIQNSLTVKCAGCGAVFPKGVPLSLITRLLMVKRSGDSVKNVNCPKCKESNSVDVVFNSITISTGSNRLDDVRKPNKKTVLFPRIGQGPDPRLCRLCQSAEPSTNISFSLHILPGPTSRTEKYSNVRCCNECAKRYSRLKRLVWGIPVFVIFLPIFILITVADGFLPGLIFGGFIGFLAWNFMRFIHDTTMSDKLNNYPGNFRL